MQGQAQVEHTDRIIAEDFIVKDERMGDLLYFDTADRAVTAAQKLAEETGKAHFVVHDCLKRIATIRPAGAEHVEIA